MIECIDQRIIGLCQRCWDSGAEGCWVEADDIGRRCYQCWDFAPVRQYIPRYRKRRGYIVRYPNGDENMFLSLSAAYAFAVDEGLINVS